MPFGGLKRRDETKRRGMAAMHEEEWAMARNESLFYSSLPLPGRSITAGRPTTSSTRSSSTCPPKTPPGAAGY